MTDDKYEVRSCVPEAAIQVCSTKDPRLSLKITLSSLAMREGHGTGEGIYHSTPSVFVFMFNVFVVKQNLPET